MREKDSIVGEEFGFDKNFIDPLFANQRVGTNSQSLLDLPGVRLRFYLFEMIFLEMDNLSKREIGNIPNTRRF